MGQIVAQPSFLMQQSLFSDLELRQIRHSTELLGHLAISADALLAWKQRVRQYQEHVVQALRPTQGLLFDLEHQAHQAEQIDPFALESRNIEFWRSPADAPGHAALYFVLDRQAKKEQPEQPLLLYIGETCKANQRWKGVHDCKRYVRNYIEDHRQWSLPVSVSIGFWPHAPHQTRPRQRLERALIEQWRSPFNKENSKHWGTPFIWGKA